MLRILIRIVLGIAVAVGLAGGIVSCTSQPLEPWHKARLGEEFDDRMFGDEVRTLDDYLALEDRLFAELRDEVYTRVGTGPEFVLVRYSSGSAADPAVFEQDYNRTFELAADNPRGGVLLLHGMSDSPYSLSTLGKRLHEEGYHVLGLRLPGHGTVPSALKHVSWQDMAAATRLGMQHLVAEVAGKPIHVIGYSTGAALALDLSIEAVGNTSLPMPASLVLVSPAIGITRSAALAGPTALLGRAPGMSRIGWSDITPEFDPFKYNSFTFNAAAQVHKLTRSVGDRVANLSRLGEAGRLPPVLVFKSTVDATVSTGAVVDRLLIQLPEQRNELVLFDINREAVMSALLVSDPGPLTALLMTREDLPFSIRLIANESPESEEIVEFYKPPFSTDVAGVRPLNVEWPQGVISLSHVALPFAPDDLLYGRYPPENRDRLFLGQAEIRGERGLLRISSDWLLRLRYNPFYDVLESRTLDWMSGIDAAGR